MGSGVDAMNQTYCEERSATGSECVLCTIGACSVHTPSDPTHAVSDTRDENNDVQLYTISTCVPIHPTVQTQHKQEYERQHEHQHETRLGTVSHTEQNGRPRRRRRRHTPRYQPIPSGPQQPCRANGAQQEIPVHIASPAHQLYTKRYVTHAMYKRNKDITTGGPSHESLQNDREARLRMKVVESIRRRPDIVRAKRSLTHERRCDHRQYNENI
jgi:hypothetical protein